VRASIFDAEEALCILAFTVTYKLPASNASIGHVMLGSAQRGVNAYQQSKHSTDPVKFGDTKEEYPRDNDFRKEEAELAAGTWKPKTKANKEKDESGLPKQDITGKAKAGLKKASNFIPTTPKKNAPRPAAPETPGSKAYKSSANLNAPVVDSPAKTRAASRKAKDEADKHKIAEEAGISNHNCDEGPMKLRKRGPCNGKKPKAQDSSKAKELQQPKAAASKEVKPSGLDARTYAQVVKNTPVSQGTRNSQAGRPAPVEAAQIEKKQNNNNNPAQAGNQQGVQKKQNNTPAQVTNQPGGPKKQNNTPAQPVNQANQANVQKKQNNTPAQPVNQANQANVQKKQNNTPAQVAAASTPAKPVKAAVKPVAATTVAAPATVPKPPKKTKTN
jgi:hypothetical protein